jgi:beta-galactosidase
MDVISWDCYPGPDEPASSVAFRHELMRGLKGGQPFMLMEQAPGQTNWMPRNRLKRPGVMRLHSVEAMAHGADTVMFFQWRQARGGPEKFHSAVVTHAGHEHTRTFQEVAAFGAELERLGDTLLDSCQQAAVALLFDWQSWWAVDYSAGPTVDLDYVATLKKYYAALWEQNLSADVVSPSADLSAYRVVVAPVLYMLMPGVADNLKAFVRGGGTLVTTVMSGLVDRNDLVGLGGYPAELREMLGLWVEEIDALLPDERKRIVFEQPWGRLSGAYDCAVICDLVNLEGARPLAVYGDDFYAGRPALTVNTYGQGQAYYLSGDAGADFLAAFLGTLCDERGIVPALSVPAGVEVTQRHKDGLTFTFVLNHNGTAARLALPAPARDLLSGRGLSGEIELAPYDVLILAQD